MGDSEKDKEVESTAYLSSVLAFCKKMKIIVPTMVLLGGFLVSVVFFIMKPELTKVSFQIQQLQSDIDSLKVDTARFYVEHKELKKRMIAYGEDMRYIRYVLEKELKVVIPASTYIDDVFLLSTADSVVSADPAEGFDTSEEDTTENIVLDSLDPNDLDSSMLKMLPKGERLKIAKELAIVNTGIFEALPVRRLSEREEKSLFSSSSVEDDSE